MIIVILRGHIKILERLGHEKQPFLMTRTKTHFQISPVIVQRFQKLFLHVHLLFLSIFVYLCPNRVEPRSWNMRKLLSILLKDWFSLRVFKCAKFLFLRLNHKILLYIKDLKKFVSSTPLGKL